MTAENQRLRISSSDQEDALKKCSMVWVNKIQIGWAIPMEKFRYY